VARDQQGDRREKSWIRIAGLLSKSTGGRLTGDSHVSAGKAGATGIAGHKAEKWEKGGSAERLPRETIFLTSGRKEDAQKGGAKRGLGGRP